MPTQHRQIVLASPSETCALAQAIAPFLTAGDTILLAGGVGAGKTHFARCMIQSVLLQPEDVPSPTYTLVQTYESEVGEIWHADLYRISQISDLEELGLTDAFNTAVCLIEWPDRLGEETPENALTLCLDAPGGDDMRVVTMEWKAPKWTKRMCEVLNE